MSFRGIDHDDFYFRLIEAGHTAIFQWIAVYAASIIGLIPIIIDLGQNPKVISISFLIYVLLIFLMTNSVYSVVSIMHKQNCWIEKLTGFNRAEQIDAFYKSRSPFSKRFLDKEKNMCLRDWAAIIGHFLSLFLIALIVIWILNLDNQSAILGILGEIA